MKDRTRLASYLGNCRPGLFRKKSGAWWVLAKPNDRLQGSRDW